MVNVVVVDATAVSVIVFTPVNDTDAEGVTEAKVDTDGAVVDDSRLV